MNQGEDVIVIIEPDDTQRSAIGQVVQRVFSNRRVIIHEVKSLREWLTINENVQPGTCQIVLLDANMPDHEGNLAAKSIWQHNSKAKLVFWSYAHRSAYLSEIRRLVPGSANFAYVMKSDSLEALAFALTSVCFHNNTYISPTCREGKSTGTLTRIDYETLIDVAFGLTDKAIAHRRNISVRGVQNRLTTLLQKLGCDPTEQPLTIDSAEFFNSRTRLVYEAFAQGHITRHDINFNRPFYEKWIAGNSIPAKKRSAATLTAVSSIAAIARDNKATLTNPLPVELQQQASL